MNVATAWFIAGLIARVSMTWIFLQASVHALKDPQKHVGIVAQYRLLPPGLVQPAAYLLPLCQLVVAAALMVPALGATAAVGGLALLATFAAAIALNLLRGRRYIECGCGGGEGQRLSPALVVRNLVLMGLLLIVPFAPPAGVIDAAVGMTVAGGAATAIAFYFATNALLRNQAAFMPRGD